MRQLRLATAVLAALIAGAGVRAQATEKGPAKGPAEFIAAERAFAGLSPQMGWVAAFKRNAAPDGIIFNGQPTNALQSLQNVPEKVNNPPLEWWPIWAGASRDNDLGFTTGPFRVGDKAFGYYFTVWARQPDGGLKWIYDGGPRMVAASPFGPQTEPKILASSVGGAGSADAALQQVQQIETTLAGLLAQDAKAAYAQYLADDGRIMSDGAEPAIEKSQFAAELARRPAKLTVKPLGGRAAAAGDMVFTYGDASWEKDGKAVQAHYVRIWQHRKEGWKLVADELLLV